MLSRFSRVGAYAPRTFTPALTRGYKIVQRKTRLIGEEGINKDELLEEIAYDPDIREFLTERGIERANPDSVDYSAVKYGAYTKPDGFPFEAELKAAGIMKHSVEEYEKIADSVETLPVLELIQGAVDKIGPHAGPGLVNYFSQYYQCDDLGVTPGAKELDENFSLTRDPKFERNGSAMDNEADRLLTEA